MTEDLHREPESGSQTDRLAGAVWRKSTKSGTNGNCVEVATNLPDVVAIRDSLDPNGTKLVVTRSAWYALLERIRANTYDL